MEHITRARTTLAFVGGLLLSSRAENQPASRPDSIIGVELGDTLRPLTSFSARSHLYDEPPPSSNPRVVWVSAELIAHEYHNQGCTLYRTRAAHHRALPQASCSEANWVSWLYDMVCHDQNVTPTQRFEFVWPVTFISRGRCFLLRSTCSMRNIRLC